MNNYKINIIDCIDFGINNLYNKKINNEETILIIPVLDYGLEDIIKINEKYQNKIILVLYEKYINIKDYPNIEMITIPNNMPSSEIKYMAEHIQ